MDAESRVAPAVGPRAHAELLDGNRLTEVLDEGPGHLLVDRGEEHRDASMREASVLFHDGCGRVPCRAFGERGQASAQVHVIGREADPILDAARHTRRGDARLDEEKSWDPEMPEALDRVHLIGPAQDENVPLHGSRGYTPRGSGESFLTVS